MGRPAATMTLPDLDNPNRYTCVEKVAILDQDTEADKPLDEGFLETVLEETNTRIKGGDLILLTIGHTDDDRPETDQPPLVGYAKNLVMGELNGRSAILADLYIETDRYDEVMQYPRRSIELWHDEEYESGFIDIVSFLRRAPARSLGLLTYRNYGQRAIYRCPKSGELMTKNEMDKIINAVVERMSASTSKFEKDKEDEKPKCDDMDKDEDTDKETDKEEEKVVAKKGKKSKKDKDDDKETEEEKEMYDEDDDMVDDYDAAVASGTDTFVPGVVEEKKAKKMRRDSDRIRLSRLEKMLGDVEQERDYFKLKLRRSERERDLKQLEAEGYQFDSVAELGHVETLDDNAYQTHLSRARKLYKKFPIGKELIATEEPKVGSRTSKEEINEILKFAAKTGLDFTTAMNTYKKSEGH